MAYHAPNAAVIQELNNIANRIRIGSIEATSKCNSGHPTSSSSCADILSVLFFRQMKYKPSEPRDPAADRFVMSKGHACPALYAAWVETGHLSKEDFMTLREYNSVYEGHPTPKIDFIDVATGSLGQGLNLACGMAYVSKYVDKTNFKVYCLLGDGEVAEGAVWEAMAFASHYKLDNLVAIIDVNRLGQADETYLGHNIETYVKRAAAFGWNALDVDGHDIAALCHNFHLADECKDLPTCLVAKTFKGRNMPGQEDLIGFHGKPVAASSKDDIVNHLNGLIKDSGTKLAPESPACQSPAANIKNITAAIPPSYEMGKMVATRAAYGKGLISIGQNCDRVYALDGDMRNSTFSQDYMKAFPDRFVECGIAEQNLVGVAVGMATRDRVVAFCSTFAAFLARAYDHIRMAAVSRSNINFFGSHCGISIGADGPSQMALEDLAMFCAIPECTVLYPSDAVSTERAVELAANSTGMCYIRGARAATPVIYDASTQFAIGKAHVVKKGVHEKDRVTVVAGGITLYHAVQAYEKLQAEGVGITVIDIFSIKPVDKATILDCVRSTGGNLLTVEDHYPEGGIASAVATALSEETGIRHRKLAVNGMPFSAPPADLFKHFKIDADTIVEAVKAFK